MVTLIDKMVIDHYLRQAKVSANKYYRQNVLQRNEAHWEITRGTYGSQIVCQSEDPVASQCMGQIMFDRN